MPSSGIVGVVADRAVARRMTNELLLAESLRDPTTVQTVAKVAAQIDRAADMVRRPKLMYDAVAANTAPTNLRRIVQEAKDVSRSDLKWHNIALHVELASGLPRVLVDALQIGQVLLNLIRNSVEAIDTAKPGADRRRIVAARRQSRFGVAHCQ